MIAQAPLWEKSDSNFFYESGVNLMFFLAMKLSIWCVALHFSTNRRIVGNVLLNE